MIRRRSPGGVNSAQHPDNSKKRWRRRPQAGGPAAPRVRSAGRRAARRGGRTPSLRPHAARRTIATPRQAAPGPPARPAPSPTAASPTGACRRRRREQPVQHPVAQILRRRPVDPEPGRDVAHVHEDLDHPHRREPLRIAHAHGMPRAGARRRRRHQRAQERPARLEDLHQPRILGAGLGEDRERRPALGGAATRTARTCPAAAAAARAARRTRTGRRPCARRSPGSPTRGRPRAPASPARARRSARRPPAPRPARRRRR